MPILCSVSHTRKHTHVKRIDFYSLQVLTFLINLCVITVLINAQNIISHANESVQLLQGTHILFVFKLEIILVSSK